MNSAEFQQWRPVSWFLVLLGVLTLCALAARGADPEPAGWYSGDMHVHRSCGDSPVSVSSIYTAMTNRNLAVVSLLADMGNGEVQDPVTDLPKVDGLDDSVSTSNRLVHWDAEWHWDAIYTNYAHQALGGHVVTLGLTNAYQIWAEYTYPVLDWAHQQGGIAGFAHMQYLGDGFPQSLTCCTPIEYPVEVALGAGDFISEDVAGSDTAVNAYYRLLNCGFRPGFAGGSDYPCGAAIGDVITYVQVSGELTYRKWIDGITNGRTVVSRNGHNEFLDLKVNTNSTPGDEIQLTGAGTVSVSVQWTALTNLTGTIELVKNGVVVASQQSSVTSGVPATLTASVDFANSGWLCARRMSDRGHEVHTAAVFVTVDGAAVRASAGDAQFYVDWMDTLLENTSAEGIWSSYFVTNRAEAQARYSAARSVFLQILAESPVEIVTTSLPNGMVGVAYSATLTASGGASPYTWSVASGSLPSGLTLNTNTGTITGTPTTAGTFSFAVQVSDTNNPAETATRSLSIGVAQAPFDYNGGGPGGPILVLMNQTNAFSVYYAEILATEGLNEFALTNVSSISDGTLAPYDVAILGQATLTSAQVTTLSNWVNQGGKLIAMRPDKQLAGLLGLVDAGSTLSEGYLLVNTSNGPGVGIVDQTMQFHGTADCYTLAGASSLATLYSNALTATANPAVTLRSVGTNGGQAAAFTFDLARSIVYTRQGNPAWAGQERDGQTPIRSDDLFYGAASFDPQPDYVDLNKVAIPQADEQQRLLANMILSMESDKKLLPRFWYFPNGYKAVVVMTGDNHATDGTAGRFNQYLGYSPTNASVDDWTAIRGTAYIFTNTPMTDLQASNYNAAGFEISLHLNTGCADFTWQSLDESFTEQLNQLTNLFPSLPSPTTHRAHCIVWSDYATMAEVELLHGIRLDANYYYWPPGWVTNRPGVFTGSAMPMRFASAQGEVIDVFQAATQMTDESDQTYPFTVDTLLDRALGAEECYGAYVANMHTDTANSPGSDAIVNSARARGVPVIAARQLLTWLDGRNASAFSSVTMTNNTLSFSVDTNPAARGIQGMVPIPLGYAVTNIAYNGGSTAYSLRGVKGMQYAFFPAPGGDYQVSFAADTMAPTVAAFTPTNGQSGVRRDASITLTFSEAMSASSINTNTILLRDQLNHPVSATLSYNPLNFTAVLEPDGPLGSLESYTVIVKGGGGGVSDASTNSLADDFIWYFSTVDGAVYSIWDNSTVPAVVSQDDDPGAITVGLKFQSAINGYVAGIRFYKGTENTGTHVGSLWTSTGTLLASVTFTNETASGWQYQALPSVVHLTSNTTYIVSYHAPVGHYSADSGYFSTGGVTNYPLRALANGEDGGNGIYVHGSSGAFPDQTYNAANYWVDLVFVTSAPPLTITTTVLPYGIVDVAYSATLMTSGGVAPLTWSIVGGALPPGLTLHTNSGTITGTPTASGIFNFTAQLTDTSDPAQTITQPFSIVVSVAARTIWPGSVEPGTVDSGPDSSVELGVKFKSDVDATVSAIRFYKASSNTGTHIGNLWTTNGTLLATTTFTDESSSGWQQANFAAPVSITSNTVYVASYHADNGHYSIDLDFFSSGGVDNPPLHALVDGLSGGNGVFDYSATSAYPTNTYRAANYWVDVVILTRLAPVLPLQTNRTIAEMSLLIVTNTAVDIAGTNVLSYQLLNPPAGAVIDTNGVITWTPSEAQGPSTNTITTVVTDIGVPPVSATNSFTVTVSEVNSAPVLPAQTDRTIDELTLLTVTNTAADADVPANVLSYQLVNPPAGAAIDAEGVITWTPTEAQGGSTNTFTTVVADNSVPPLSTTNSFTAAVAKMNSAPVLPAQADRSMDELTVLTVTNTATDSDIPVDGLSYQLIGPPDGAAIDANGVIAWTPTESQGPSTNTFTTVVTDNGAPPLSATNSFTVTVNEVNTAPVLPAQIDRAIDELTLLTVTNTAADADVPANTLSYQLLVAPAGAVIDAQGVITWTPTESQGPSTNTFTTVVTDNGVPALSVTNSFTVTVSEVNTAPVLPAQADRSLDELTLLTVTNTATDADVPANVLSYELLVAPAGAVINGEGVISWTPTESQGPSTNTITTVVTDNGAPPLSVTNSFTVTVNEVNTAPVLPVQTDRTIDELTLITVTNTATDADLPANALSYELLVAPASAVIDAEGVISWTPTESQGPSTNTITTVVTDNGAPALSATNSFTVTVSEVNTAPVLPAQTDRTINELTLLTVTNAATDADVPVNVLSYELLVSPAGAVIDGEGVISWTPTESQGPSTNTITTVVTDNGAPPLSVTNSFTVTVSEVNTAPVLPVQTDRTIDELTLITVTNTATDADLPANALSYELLVAPAGAVIDAEGVISWTPTESQGPSTNTITTVVTDNGAPPLSATNSFTVTVSEVNTAPVLPAQADRSLDELTLLTVTNTATDADVPANVLSYELLVSPAGAVIDGEGVISWTPTESQGPSTNTITTVVTDNGVPPLSATNTFTVTVNEVNTAPVLPVQTDRTIDELTLLTVTNTTTDGDVPANVLSYELLVAPAGTVIDAQGVITWTPTESQGPSTNTFTTVVTDDGVPALSATNSFTVTVSEVNTAPVLPAQTDRSLDELTLLTVTNTATDADVPANVLSYELLVAPAGAVIDAQGVITWTPTESQGPSTNTITTVVTDDGAPPLSVTNSFTVTVSEVNTAPVLPVQTDRTIDELTLITVTNTATDGDVPANVLSYELLVAPAGAVIDAEGVISWTPTESQGPSTNTITTVVTDNGAPALSATNSFTMTVSEVNTAPVLPAQADRSLDELTLLTVTNTATDADVPANVLSYELLVSPAGAVIDGEGVISWTPTESQGPSTNTITTVVTDNGAPPLSVTNSFTVTVSEVNTAPVLPVQTDRTIDELTLITVTNTATDGDVPANVLSYELLVAPAGAVIDAEGVIRWTPTEAQGGTTNTITTVVTDNGVPALSVTNSFTVTVSEVNTAPVLPAQTDRSLDELTLLTMTNTATDADVPANVLSYELLVSPAGAVIDAEGVIRWTPTESQAPTTNTFTTVVTDNGLPPLSRTNSFTVTVSEVNTAPVLAAQADRNMEELTLLTVTNTATDADVPANTLSYLLLVAPAGAVIDAQGVITWTPTEAQGGTTNIFTTVVTDNGAPVLGAANSFQVVVTKVNSAPVLSTQTDRNIDELTLITVTNTATDADLPPDALSYQLLEAPAGAAIDGEGVISWTPTESQGPSTNTITTVVTDNGVPALSVTNSFTVTVNEVNTAPVLPVQADRTIDELTLLTVTNTATDADVPANTLSYELLVAPAGAVIDAEGVISWTPTESQGPSTNTFTAVVTDDGVPPLSVTNSFTVTVSEVNTAPVLPAQTDRSLDELTLLTVTNTATDADVPANVLSYELLVSPAGAVIDGEGVIRWTPTESQGPSTNTITTVVTDNGAPPLSVTNSFTVTVSEVNTAPVLPVQTDRTIDELTLITVTNTATDADLPANALSYELLVAPAGAVIDGEGVISWTPTESQGPSTNTFTAVVTDDGVPPLSVTNSFTVTVSEVNTAPVLPAQTDRSLDELTLLTVTNTATDADVPANVLSYELLVSPAGAVIDGEGVISWTPTESQGPSTNTITTVVTDNGVPPLSVTNSFTVTVNEVNTAPVLPAQTDRSH